MYMLRMDWNWHEVGEWDERIYNIVRFKGSDRGTILGRFAAERFFPSLRLPFNPALLN